MEKKFLVFKQATRARDPIPSPQYSGERERIFAGLRLSRGPTHSGDGSCPAGALAAGFELAREYVDVCHSHQAHRVRSGSQGDRTSEVWSRPRTKHGRHLARRSCYSSSA